MRVHRLPEAMMAVRAELAGFGEQPERRQFPRGLISFNPVDHSGRQDEEAAIDPAPVADWLLHEAVDDVPVQIDHAVAAGRLYSGDGRGAAVAAMKCDECADVDVGKAVAIGEAERIFIPQI